MESNLFSFILQLYDSLVLGSEELEMLERQTVAPASGSCTVPGRMGEPCLGSL
jgi:hypothetical protein